MTNIQIKKVGILYHPQVPEARVRAGEIARIVATNGGSAWLCSAWEPEKARASLDGTDLIVTVGGDGTILRAVQVALPGRIPITGVNMGRLGFLTELAVSEIDAKIPEILEGKGWLDERATLTAEVRSGAGVNTYHALNDVVLARGAICRVIAIDVEIGDETFTSYRTDGVVLATGTGSTGYNLSAGGPVLYPQSGDFLLVPLAPHLGLTYPLVLDGETTVTLRVTNLYDATVSIDGHINLPLSKGGTVLTRKGPDKVRFLRIHRKAFYSTLEQKLKGTRQSEPGKKS